MNFNVPGYTSLASVFQRAYDQAAKHKGAERHANDKPFHEQPMQTVANHHGIGFILGQASKKAIEAQGMLGRGDPDKAIHELLGAINYIAGAVINIEMKRMRAAFEQTADADPGDEDEAETDSAAPAAHAAEAAILILSALHKAHRGL